MAKYCDVFYFVKKGFFINYGKLSRKSVMNAETKSFASTQQPLKKTRANDFILKYSCSGHYLTFSNDVSDSSIQSGSRACTGVFTNYAR